MKYLISIATIIFLASCSGSVISKKLAASDSLVITFNVPNSDSVIKTVSTTEKKAIRKLATFVDGKSSLKKDCGFDGNMVFYRDGEVLLPVIFRYTEDGCFYFMFNMDNKVFRTSMNNEAIEFIKSLAEGKAWY